MAVSVNPTIAGGGTGVSLSGDETVAGVKTFTSSPIVPNPAITDDSTKAASTAFIRDLSPTVALGQVSGTVAGTDVVGLIDVSFDAEIIGNTTFAALTNPANGQTYLWDIKIGGTGNYTITFDSAGYYHVGGQAPVPTAVAERYLVSGRYNSTLGKILLSSVTDKPTSATWANIKNTTPATGTQMFATDLFGGIHVYYNGTRWRAMNKHVTAFSEGRSYSLPDTASTAFQLYAHPTLLIPAGFIGPADTIHVQSQWSHTADAGAGNVTLEVQIDTVSTGVAGVVVNDRTVNATGSTKRENYIRMNNSVASQNMYATGTDGAESGNAIATATINFAVDQYVKFVGDQGTANTGLPQLRGYSVVILQGN